MQAPTPTNTPPIFVRRSQVKNVFGLAPSTIDRLEAQGLFPRRRKIGAGCVGWLFEEGRQAIEELAKEV